MYLYKKNHVPTTICITGGAGFIGSHLARYYHRREHTVVVLDNLSTGSLAAIGDLVDGRTFFFYRADIRDRDALGSIMRGHRCQVCINCAALVSVPDSLERPRETEEINVVGLINLLEHATGNGLRVFVHASSAAVYGDGEAVPREERMDAAPHSPYAITKLAGEYYARLYARTRGIAAISCRFFNVFGDGQDPASPYAAVVPSFITRAIRNEAITIHGDGEQLRDFIYVEDLVEAIDYLVAICAGSPRTAGDIFNIGYGRPVSINTLARTIIRITGSQSPLVHAGPRPGDIAYSCACVDKLHSLGYRAAIGFGTGLRRTIEWYREKSPCAG